MKLKDKKILILGATTETIKLVEKANKLGMITYVADPYEDSKAKKSAKHPVLIDCFDVESLCKLVVNEKIDGILPGCADVLVPSYFELCKKTNKYCYVNKDILNVFNNKNEFKKILEKFNLSTIKDYSIKEAKTLSENKYPLFVKPVDNNSSKGMSIVYSNKNLEFAINKALSCSRSHNILIEDYLVSDDVTIGFYLQDGKIEVAYFGDRFTIKQPNVGSITAGLLYPSKYIDLYYKTVHSKVEKMCKYLHFTDGFLQFQGFVKDDEILFYDPALRIAGGQEYIFCEKILHVDILKNLLNYAVEGKMSYVNEIEKLNCKFNNQYASNLAFSVKCCKISKIDGLDYMLNNKNIINITQEHFEGDLIDKIGTAQQNIFRIHIVCSTKQELIKTINDVQKKVIVYDENGNNAMLKGLDIDKW